MCFDDNEIAKLANKLNVSVNFLKIGDYSGNLQNIVLMQPNELRGKNISISNINEFFLTLINFVEVYNLWSINICGM